MKNKTELETKKIKIINKEILINGGDLDLYLDLYLDGKQILTKKADSILANFLRILYLQMGRDTRDNKTGTFYKLYNSFTASSILSLSAGENNKVRITLTSAPLSTLASAGKITLGGFQGVSIDGKYNYTKISTYQVDIDGTSYTSGWVTGTGGISIYEPITNLGRSSYYSFQNAGIVIGTGTEAVLIDDQLMEKQIPSIATDGGLIYNASTVSQDTNDAASAQITFTRTFSNSSALTIQVNEIGLLMMAGNSPYTILTMRDIIPGGVNVATGKTLTVNYRIKTTLNEGTDPGGFLVSFMRMLYRQAANAQRAIFDINNESRTYGSQKSSFGAIKNGGMNIEYPYDSETEAGYKHGIVLGMGDNSVAMGDYYLTMPITHGSGTNQMLYYGGFAENFEVGANYAQFSIIKAIENNSGNTIQVKEYALTAGSGNFSGGGDSSGAQIVYLYTMTRNVLTTPVNVENQQIIKVVYKLKAIVGI